MATILNEFKIDDPSMSFKGTVRGHSSIYYLYACYDQFFDLSSPCMHMYAFRVLTLLCM